MPLAVAAWAWWVVFAVLRVSEAVKRTDERLDALADRVEKLKAAGLQQARTNLHDWDG